MTDASVTTAAAPSAASRANNLPLALLWMAGALASFSMIAIAGREAGRGAETMQIMFYRSLIGLPIIVAVALAAGVGTTTFTRRRLPLHLLRAVNHFVAQFSWLHALGLITLAELFAIEFTAPLWVALTAPLFLAEKLTLVRLAAGLLGFVGVLAIAQPGTASFGLGTALGLVASLGFAANMITTKMLTRTETTVCVLFHMTWMQLVISSVLIGFKPAVPDLTTSLWIGAIAILGLTAHYSLTQAFAHADAINVAPMDFLRLPLIIAVGAFIYGEALTFWVLVGAVIVVAANVINMFGERLWGQALR
ncbi:MAG: DMT family transporter [Hyphomicrobiaceae bacterium]